jgi:hypothetical protein
MPISAPDGHWPSVSCRPDAVRPTGLYLAEAAARVAALVVPLLVVPVRVVGVLRAAAWFSGELAKDAAEVGAVGRTELIE